MKEAFEKIVEQLEDDEKHTFDGCINKRYAKQIVQEVAKEYVPDICVGNNNWIPVSERLPEDNGVYFVTLDDDVMPRCIDVRNFHNGKFEQRFIVSPLQDKCLEKREVAWMPLPEPYKGE